MPGLLSLRPFASMARADKFFRGGLNEKSKAEVKSQPRQKSMRSRILPLQNAVPDHADMHDEQLPKNYMDEKLKAACNCGDEGDCHPSSVCYASVVDTFIFEGIDQQQTGSKQRRCSNGPCFHPKGKADVDEETVFGKELLVVVQRLIPCTSPWERSLLLDVSMFLRTAQEFAVESGGGDSPRSALRRKLMMHLRLLGYEAAVCNSRWDHSHGFPGGDYEYIDVIEAAKGGTASRNRLIVDIDFRSQFKIARPTADYIACLQMLPAIFVGRADRLKQIVDLVSDASRRSLTKRDMHLPPWRTSEYMKSKWLSPYQRVFVDVPALAAIESCTSTAVPTPVAQLRSCSQNEPANQVEKNKGESQVGYNNAAGIFSLVEPSVHVASEEEQPSVHVASEQEEQPPVDREVGEKAVSNGCLEETAGLPSRVMQELRELVHNQGEQEGPSLGRLDSVGREERVEEEALHDFSNIKAHVIRSFPTPRCSRERDHFIKELVVPALEKAVQREGVRVEA
eukprot:TRINITY_DN323_c0_g3_i1.p1 TRINITY_DN323_c0_g3~~TRINITY_DN323_c0_g3_i1.p1  ORF type:complete len:510 (-),score=92.92 TRINITY_DN323_c0_g3_i1:401-1930(-)